MYKITINYGFPKLTGKTGELNIYTDKEIGIIERDKEEIAKKKS